MLFHLFVVLASKKIYEQKVENSNSSIRTRSVLIDRMKELFYTTSV